MLPSFILWRTIIRLKKEALSESNIDKATEDFGKYLNGLPKQKVRFYLNQEEKRKLEAWEAEGKKVTWPSEVIILNGYRYEVQLGKEVELPEPVAQIAKDAGLC
jgi:hypothetical protein